MNQNTREPDDNVGPLDLSTIPLPEPVVGFDADTGTLIPFENTADGEDDTPIEHTFQTADGTEQSDTVRAADSTFIPVSGTPPIVTSPQESHYGDHENEPTVATRPPDDVEAEPWKQRKAA